MKKIFLYIILLLPASVFAQQPEQFDIKSNVGHINAPAKAYLIYQLGANRVIDTALIVNGSFEFKGTVINPGGALIIMDRLGLGLDKLDSGADNLSFYIDKGSFSINSPDSIAKAKITGSPINDDNAKLMARLKPLIEEAGRLHTEETSALEAQKYTVAYQNEMQAKYKQLQLSQKATLKLFIASNPDSYLSLLALNSVGGPAPEPAELDPLYNSLSDRLKATETAKNFKKSLDGLRNTAIGVIAPDFTQTDINGVPVKLSSFRGKYVLVDFWASWCQPCRQENPNIVRVYNKFKDKNFTILGVSLDKPEGKDAWLAAIKNDGLSWTQVSDLKFWNNQVAALYDVTSIPSDFLLDPTGKIIARDLRGDDLESKLNEVLAK